jgi:hypothetical protein
MMRGMKNRTRLTRQAVALASMILTGLHGAKAANSGDSGDSGDPQLLGCWRAERVEQTLADGRVWTDVGGCTLKFEAQHITSACVLRAGNQPVRYSYTIVTPGSYRARIVDHPARRQAEGSERDYLYRVEGDRLFIVTFPQTATPAPVSPAVKVESVSIKVGSASDLQSRSNEEQAGCEGRMVTAPLPVPTRVARSTP